MPGTGGSRRATITVFECSVRKYWPTVDLRLVGPRSLPSDLTGEEANVTDHPALGVGVLKMWTMMVDLLLQICRGCRTK